MIAESTRVCPVCRCERSAPHHFSSGGWRVVRCANCGMVYVVNPPEQTALLDEFAWEKTSVVEREARRTTRGSWYYSVSDGLKRVKKFIRNGTRVEIELLKKWAKPGKVLDLGCGGGLVLKNLPAGFVPFGIEPSPRLYENANRYAESQGGYVRHGLTIPTIEEFPDESFSAVIARSYLEHEAHPLEVCRQAHRVLESSGVMLVKVPNVACLSSKLRGRFWPGVRLPDHVNYFRRQDLMRLLIRAGFEDVMIPLTFHLPTSDNMWAVVVKSEQTKTHGVVT